MPSIDISNYPSTVARFGGNEQRATVFLDRYAKKGVDGNPVEFTPEEMWERVAAAISRIEDPEQRFKFRRLLDDFKFVPGGRILSGAGVDAQVTYYNCYVVPVETKQQRLLNAGIDIIDVDVAREHVKGSDSREAIFDTIGLMVDIMSRGGGVGINWSVLRPKGAYLKTVNGTTSGPVSWMDVASRAVGVVEQGGSRRGAAMFMLDDWHPDIEEFIDAKRDFSLITNANVSVAISDDFMSAVENDADWSLGFPDTSHPRYNEMWDGNLRGWAAKGYPVTVYRTVKARDLWRKLTEAAWASGEPGVVFLERYNKMRTASYVEEGTFAPDRIISVNPCGEQGLEPYAVCNLGSMNLTKYVRNARHAHGKTFDFTEFAKDAADATEFLDRVIDENFYFLPENEDIQKRYRRIGLGVMGLADTLIALGIRYGSPAAVDFTRKVFKTMKHAAVSRSAFLAERYGAAPGWQKSMLRSPYLAEFYDTPVGNQIAKHGLRNLFLLTQAPTGTTSILAGVNSGIEPYFAFEYTRKDRTGTHRVVHPVAGQLANKDRTYWPDFYVEAGQVTVQEHIAMQAAAQDYIDSSVSKTINGPNSHTVEDVEKAYWLAWESGLKGLAYFRDGSGRAQVLYKEEPKAESEDEVNALRMSLDEANEIIADLRDLVPYAVEYARPSELRGRTLKVRTEAGTAYVTVNYDGDKPVEVFVNVGKAGSDIMELGEAIGRLASLALRHGASLGGVANQLEGIGGNVKFNKPLAHAIGQALSDINREDDDSDIEALEAVLPAEPVVVVKKAQPGPSTIQRAGQMCPDCQNFSVVLEEGCKKCVNCGWSAC